VLSNSNIDFIVHNQRVIYFRVSSLRNKLSEPSLDRLDSGPLSRKPLSVIWCRNHLYLKKFQVPTISNICKKFQPSKMEEFFGILSSIQWLGSNNSTGTTPPFKKGSNHPYSVSGIQALLGQVWLKYAPQLLTGLVLVCMVWVMFFLIRSSVAKAFFWLFPSFKTSKFLRSLIHSPRFSQVIEGIVDRKADIIASDTAAVVVDLVKDFSQKLKDLRADITTELDDKCHMLSQDTGKVDVECAMRKNAIMEAISREVILLRGQLDVLSQQCFPPADPVLADLIGPNYLDQSSLSPSVKDYVDAKLKNMGINLASHRSRLENSVQKESSKLKEDIKLLHNYVVSEVNSPRVHQDKKVLDIETVVSKHTAELDEIKGKFVSLYDLVQANNARREASSVEVGQVVGSPGETPVRLESVAPVSNLIETPVRPVHPVIQIPPPIQSFAYPHSFTSSTPVPIIYQAAGNVPLPKFNPQLDTAENFISDIQIYMKRKRFAPDDHVLMLTPIFDQDKSQLLWWKHAKTVVNTWDDFKAHFLSMYGNEEDRHAALEKLLMRRQTEKETFQKFAFEMDLQYRKIYKISNNEFQKEILNFISERASVSLKPHLLGCNAPDLYALIRFATKIEVPVPEEKKKDWTPRNKDKSHGQGQHASNSTTRSDKPTEEKSKTPSVNESNTQRKDGNSRSRDQPTCQHCHKKGHKSEACYMLKPRVNMVQATEVAPAEVQAPVNTANRGSTQQGNGRRE